MSVFLLFLSEGEERHYASSQERNTGESTPQRDVRGISGLRNIGRRRDRHRLIFVLNVLMRGNLHVIPIQALEDYQA